ncbi:restriction endonuclease subunit S [Corynebacterium mastitidis]|uniref:restriction endonuclease subunit S n=1 Tax=Corynebacterium mastitidis TaxID=161890 RepID=UPI00254D612B|nr:restriction endonuclease subunit S [Corynebacterium mastitidis]MDK8450310.1 restriction endonuclease subunit S [Corynebacterium mastitidis]
MELDVSSWEEFAVSSIFAIRNGRGITAEEIAENPGTLKVVQSGEENNGVMGSISAGYCAEMNYVYSRSMCLTVARTGTARFVSFQPDGCVVGDSAKLLLLKHKEPTIAVLLFLQVVLQQLRFKYSYGRKVTEFKYSSEAIDLPIQHNADGVPVIDRTHQFHPEGYVPDWGYMEQFIRGLDSEPITTKNSPVSTHLNTHKWIFFLLNDLCSIGMGNKMDFSAMAADTPTVNFVGRSAENNGVMGVVDRVDNVEPYPAGSLTVALGGSLGSTFYQDRPFYTSQNVSVLQFDSEKVSPLARLFVATMIEFESRFKYFPFGRELNKYIRTIYGFDLPIQCDAHGNPTIDPTKSYHPEGFIPDWNFMENFMRSLPYGDRISETAR